MQNISLEISSSWVTVVADKHTNKQTGRRTNIDKNIITYII